MFRSIACSVVIALTCAVTTTASADNVDDARAHYERGLAAFALEHFAEAADEYEKAFALKPDWALLYNAAQAHRLAGHYDRALRLYQSYLRIFGKQVSNQAEVERHIAELRKTLEAQQQAQKSPPVGVKTPESVPSTTRPSEPPPPPPQATTAPTHETPPPVAAKPLEPTASPAPNALVASAPPPREHPVYKKPWFWAVVGGAVAVAAVGVGIGVGLGGSSQNPTPSLGATTVH